MYRNSKFKAVKIWNTTLIIESRKFNSIHKKIGVDLEIEKEDRNFQYGLILNFLVVQVGIYLINT